MIRAASSSADFEACAAIFNEVSIGDRISAEQIAEAKADGVDLLLYGAAGYAFAKKSSVADATYLMVRVRPGERRQGVGSALLAAVRERALPTIWGRVREDDGAAREFVRTRGFAEVGLDVTVLLTVKPGDGEWRDDIAELTQEHLRGAYEVFAEAVPETALPQIAKAPPYAEWVEREQRLADSTVAFVALDGAHVVGYASLGKLGGMPNRLENNLTAVLKSHRGRGIAFALKRAQIAWAAEHGYTEIVTDMVEANAPMRALNVKLGYIEQPGWVVVEGPR